MNLKQELLEIACQIRGLNKTDFSWKKIKELLEEGDEKVRSSNEEITKEIENQKVSIFFEALEMASYFSEPEMQAEAPASDEDLNFLQEIAETAPKYFDWAEKESPAQTEGEKNGLFEAKERAEKLKKAVEKEKSRRQQSGQSNSSSSDSGSSRSSSPDFSNEINSLNKKITELQNQIEELKKNQNKDNSTNQENQQKIKNLESQKQQIQTKLNQKQSQQKELKNKINSQPPEKQFNWLYVVIPVVVLLIVMGIVIAYLVGKKNKRE